VADPVNLDAYLTRLGLTQPLAPTAETLRALHVAHLGAFRFDNLEIQQGGTVRVDLDSIERKFLGGGGGYCFEQNTLFSAALRELGFDVTPLLARVGPPDQRSLTHMLLRVRIEDQDWLADVGFGGTTPLEPIPLQENIRVEQRGLAYSLRRDEYFWTLSLGAEDLYGFSEAPVTAGDIEIANWYTSTHPASIFRRTLTIQRVTPEERLILRPRLIVRIRDGVWEETPIEPGDLRRHARELFGVELGDACVAELHSEQLPRIS
jgi:N-hydroxyarylamine O-acetyltransferase